MNFLTSVTFCELRDLQDKEGVLDIIMDCDKLLGSLPRVNWSSPIATMTENLVEKCLEFLKANFVEVLQSKRFMDLGKVSVFNLIPFMQKKMQKMIKVKNLLD